MNNKYKSVNQEDMDQVLKIKLNQKLNKFTDLCGDWDFRNIDMTMAHLQSISINEDSINISCEYYSYELEEYISCDGGTIKDKKLVEDFKKMNINDRYEVKEYIDKIEDKIDWEQVANKLDKETQKYINENKNNGVELC